MAAYAGDDRTEDQGLGFLIRANGVFTPTEPDARVLAGLVRTGLRTVRVGWLRSRRCRLSVRGSVQT